MSEIYWLNPISGSFTNPAYWSGDVVPGASDDAIINAVGERRFTVTVSTHVEVQSIQTSVDAKLSINHGTFFATEGTGSGANAGIILAAGHGKLEAGGQMTNSGSIVLGNASRGGTLLVSGTLSLGGGGEVELSGAGQSLIEGGRHSKYPRLINVDNTIAGSGTIGVYSINAPAGVIDANAANPLSIDHLSNDGLVEATGSGGLTIGYAWPSDGRFLAGNGSAIEIGAGQLDGVTLMSEGSGEIGIENVFATTIKNQATLGISGFNKFFGGLDNSGYIRFPGGYSLFYPGSIYGGGTIYFNKGAGLDLGGGTIDNLDNTIVGAGGLESDFGVDCVLVNEARGLIDATGSSVMTLFGTYLTVQNAGTIESTGNGGLHLLASMENSGLVVANAGTLEIGDLYDTHELTNSGTIESTGAGDVVVEVAIVNTGVLSVQDGRKLTADGAVSGNGVAVINVGSLDFASSFNEAVTFTGAGTLELAQSQGFTNAVTGFSGTGTTILDLGDIGFVSPGEATYSGNKSSGVLTVTDGTHTAKFNLKGNYLGTTFVASSDGHGGTDVVAQGVDAAWRPVHAFVAAMAGIGLSGGQAVHSGVALTSREILLTSPRVASA